MFKEMQASVWWLDLNALPVPPSALRQRFLTQDERARQKRFEKPDDQLRFAAGRALCRAVLARMAQNKPEKIKLAVGQHGRPFVKEGADGYWFNLTHSGAIVALAIAPFPKIGVDTEEVRSSISDDLSLKVCTDRERAYLAATSLSERRRLFFDFWVLKEAFSKADGQGLWIDPVSCEFDFAKLPLAVRLPTERVSDWQFKLWHLGCGQPLAVCAKAPPSIDVTFQEPKRADKVITSSV